MEFLSIRQLSAKWGISTRRIQILCAEDRIPGAMRVDSTWVIPADAEKPKDEKKDYTCLQRTIMILS